MAWLKPCVLTAVSALLPLGVVADLGAALRRAPEAAAAPAAARQGASAARAASADAAPLPAAAAPVAAPLAIRLERVSARPVARGSAPGGGGGSFYVGRVLVGQPPQALQVLFDTSSGHVLLPHRACQSTACLEHRRYSPWESRTATDVEAHGGPVQEGRRFAVGNVTRTGVIVTFTQADLGEGQASGVLVRDWVCLGTSGGSRACADTTVVAATRLADVPFRAMPHDGILGLGLHGLTAGPLCSFFGRLAEASRNMVPQFGIHFGSDSGELFLGGLNTAHLAAPLRWFPVERPEDGFWQVAIRAVRVANATVDACRAGCRAVIDTGASRLGMLAANVPKLRTALSSAPAPGGGCHGSSLEFDLGGMVLTLRPADYADAACVPQLGPLDLGEEKFAGVYAFGETVLRRYYAAFDWKAQRVGFAPAAVPRRVRLGHRPAGPPRHAEAIEVV